MYAKHIAANRSGIYMMKWRNGRFYIGKSNNLRARVLQHKRKMECGNHENEIIQRHFDKYGHRGLRWKVLEYCDKQHARRLEKHYLQLFYDDPMCINIVPPEMHFDKEHIKVARCNWCIMNVWTKQPVYFNSYKDIKDFFGMKSSGHLERTLIVCSQSEIEARKRCDRRQTKYLFKPSKSQNVIFEGQWYRTVMDAHAASEWPIKYSLFQRLLVHHKIDTKNKYEAWKAQDNHNVREKFYFDGKPYYSKLAAWEDLKSVRIAYETFVRYLNDWGCKTTEHIFIAKDHHCGQSSNDDCITHWEGRPVLSSFLALHMNGRWYKSMAEATRSYYNEA